MKGNLQQCRNFRTISLISHLSKVMLKDHTEQIEATSGEDHRRRTGRLQSWKEHHRADLSTYAFSVRNIYSASMTSTVSSQTSRRPSTGFGTQLCGQPWSKYNTCANLIRVIKNLYDKAASAVLFNGSIACRFRATDGVRQGCLLSPALFNIFVERIVTDALEDHEGTVSIGGRTITNLRFADDIDGLTGVEEEVAKLVEHFNKVSTA